MKLPMQTKTQLAFETEGGLMFVPESLVILLGCTWDIHEVVTGVPLRGDDSGA